METMYAGICDERDEREDDGCFELFLDEPNMLYVI